ncbi:MAG: FAD-dependent oxidoreductase [Leptolyngbya sp. IPPAS B-1204]
MERAPQAKPNSRLLTPDFPFPRFTPAHLHPMQSFPQPIVKDLVLIGGGHSHAIALKQWGMQLLAGVRVTLISDVSHTPYSGMLPAYVAGLYDYDDCHIDLRPLSQFAKTNLILDRAVGLDLQQNRILLANHPPIGFDLLSLDLGSTPATSTVPGAADHAIPVKPISQFLTYWDQLVAELTNHPGRLRVAVVGGGAGGVELTLAVQARLAQLYCDLGQSTDLLDMHLLHRGGRLVPERSTWVGERLGQILQQRGVSIHLNETVVAISAGDSAKKLAASQG